MVGAGSAASPEEVHEAMAVELVVVEPPRPMSSSKLKAVQRY